MCMCDTIGGGKGSAVQPLPLQESNNQEKEKNSGSETNENSGQTKQHASTIIPPVLLSAPSATTEKDIKEGEYQVESELQTASEIEGVDKMVDIRSSSMIKPCLIGSPPPSVLRERSKLRRDRLTQSRLAATSNPQQPVEETVLPSTGETPAIHLSCSVDDPDLPDEDNMEIAALDPSSGVSLGTNNTNSTERSNSLTPPPRLISFNLASSSSPTPP